jgi:FKBP-type peptidyl-prolyl cis-trans isomerase SlyD
MKISREKVVGIEYTLKGADGLVIDSNVGDEPLFFLQGFGTLVPGLEAALEGRVAGDRFEVEVKAADGYGEYDPQRLRSIPRANFPQLKDAKPGMMLEARGPEGVSAVTVSEVTEDTIVIDGNHPMAGKDLFFSIYVSDVRDATAEEKSHGHVHGPGGHHHH